MSISVHLVGNTLRVKSVLLVNKILHVSSIYLSVCFGLKSNPYHALRTVRQLIKDDGDSYPLAMWLVIFCIGMTLQLALILNRRRQIRKYEIKARSQEKYIRKRDRSEKPAPKIIQVFDPAPMAVTNCKQQTIYEVFLLACFCNEYNTCKLWNSRSYI